VSLGDSVGDKVLSVQYAEAAENSPMDISYAILILLHILLLVYWLGADLGVFYSGSFLTKSDVSVESRRTVMKVLHFVDLFPRMSLVLMLPVGITLALQGGYATLPDGWENPVLAIVWIAAFGWLSLVIRLFRGATPVLTRCDYAIRYLVIAGLVVLSACAFAGVGPVVPGATWLALKLIIFAAIMCSGLAIRVTFKPFVADFGRLVREGSTPEIEAAMKRGQARVRPFVLAIWVALIVEAFLGISKP
jgi:hypothetical protein